MVEGKREHLQFDLCSPYKCYDALPPKEIPQSRDISAQDTNHRKQYARVATTGECQCILETEFDIPATQETSVPDLYIASLPAKGNKFESNREETSDKSELGDISQNHWPVVHKI